MSRDVSGIAPPAPAPRLPPDFGVEPAAPPPRRPSEEELRLAFDLDDRPDPGLLAASAVAGAVAALLVAATAAVMGW